MYIVYDNNFLVIETSIETKDFSEYVKQSLNVESINIDYDCVGQIYINGVFLKAPTPYHTAYKGEWVLSNENLLLMSQVVSMYCSKILKQCAVINTGQLSSFMNKINTLSMCKNKTKAYYSLKSLLKTAPDFVKNNVLLE